MIVQKERLRHPNASVERGLQRPKLHVVPAFFQELLAVAALALHGAAISGVASLVAPFDVAGYVFKRPLLTVFVDLGRA